MLTAHIRAVELTLLPSTRAERTIVRFSVVSFLIPLVYLLESKWPHTCRKVFDLFLLACILRIGNGQFGGNEMVKKTEPALQEQASKGGRARAKALSAKKRSEIARLAVEARWEKAGKPPVPRATHAGTIEIGGREIACAVLKDGRRVLTQETFLTAIGRSKKGKGGQISSGPDGLPPFLSASALKSFIDNDLRKATVPIQYRSISGVRAHGYEASLLPQVCDVYLKARDARKLTRQQTHVATACDILMRGLAHVGIIAMVDEATGYQDARARDALARILEKFIAKELRKWIRTFEADFYKEMFRLKGLPYDGTCRRPQYFGHLTNDLVYSRLAPGVLDELRKRNPRTTPRGNRPAKHFQHLTPEFGHPRLREHIHAVTSLMRASDNWKGFYALIQRALPKHYEMPLWEEQGESAG